MPHLHIVAIHPFILQKSFLEMQDLIFQGVLVQVDCAKAVYIKCHVLDLDL